MELVRKPIRFISVSTSATWVHILLPSPGRLNILFHSGFLPAQLLPRWSNKVLGVSRSNPKAPWMSPLLFRNPPFILPAASSWRVIFLSSSLSLLMNPAYRLFHGIKIWLGLHGRSAFIQVIISAVHINRVSAAGRPSWCPQTYRQNSPLQRHHPSPCPRSVRQLVSHGFVCLYVSNTHNGGCRRTLTPVSSGIQGVMGMFFSCKFWRDCLHFGFHFL